MEKFNLLSGKEFKLSKLGAAKIAIKKIKIIRPTENAHFYLGFPIKYVIKFPNGKTLTDSIHPISYFNNFIPSAKSPATNVEMNEIIEFCKYTTLSINNPIPDSDQSIELEISYQKISPTAIEIYVTETIDGYSFELTPDSKKRIKTDFPEAIVAGRFMAGRETLQDFQTIYGTFNNYVLTALTGLSENETKLLDYQIINSATGKVIYSVNKQ